MSKRGAVGPQGGKESDLFAFNMSSTPEEKPQRATAAQLATRKIKEARRRTRPSTAAPSNTTGASFSPFNSIDPNAASSSQPASNGFSFGQSQSFPGAVPSTTQPAQNGGSLFAFGAGADSSSFSFNSSFGASGSSSNPFANINPTSGSQQTDTGSFSGFKGNMFNSAPSGSSAPAQQALSTGGLFGTSSKQQNNAPGSLFGSSTAGGTASPSVTAPATTGSIFGQTTMTSATPTNIFGQSTTDKPSPFGQSTAFDSDSMQTSPDPKANAAAAAKPSLFGSSNASQPGFGASIGFTSAAGGSVFGGTISAAQQTASKPLFGAKSAEQTAPTTPSLLGATSQPTTAASTSTSVPNGTMATTTTSTNLFGTTSSAKPVTSFQSPFQSSNLFSGVSAAPATSEATKEKEQEKKQAEAPQTGFQFSTAGSSASNLFSQSANAAAPPPSTSTGLFQAPSTGGLFAPKPATTDTDKTKDGQANPFSNLFTPKPDAAKQNTQEQKPLPSPAPFSGLFAAKPSAPAEAAKTAQQDKPVKPTTAFSPSTPSSSNIFAPQSSITSATSESKTQAPVFTSAPQTTFKVNGPPSVSPAPAVTSVKAPEVQCAEKFMPRNLPSSLSDQQKKDAQLVHRLRLLNESFQREIAKLNPATDDFDAHMLFYMRVREVIGAPAGPYMSKRKASEADTDENEMHSVKKTKSFGANGTASSTNTDGLLSATNMNIGPSSITNTPSKLFDGKQNGAIVNEKDMEGAADKTPAKAQAEPTSTGDSTTASIFAQSFSKSRTDDADSAVTTTEAARPSTPEFNKPPLFSTTPTTSPAKSLFPTPGTTKENATSSSLFSQSTSKPTFTAPTTGADSAPKNPFVLKPTDAQDAKSSNSASLPIPKFGGGTTTNFFAQFKTIADKDAEKEKEKRKAEDFDSEEEDELEWERKDAEKQRKKREELESQSKKRPKFVPGKGFVFEDESKDAVESNKATETAVSSGASVFDNKRETPAKSNNIFGHLSATPSEAEEDNDADDTEEASAAGDEPDEVSKESSVVPGSEDEESRDAEASEADSKAVSISGAEFSANDSSDDGDLSKALKKSKQAASTSTLGGRSLFDRVQYDPEGKPKRQTEGEAQKPFSSLFSSSSKTSSPPTANPFAAISTPASGQAPTIGSKPASSVFSSSANASGGLFTSTPGATSGTPSIFGQNNSKITGDKTWKPDTPIKFGESTATAPSKSSKPNSDIAVGSTDASKPFSTLFGAPAAGTKSSGNGQPSFGFSFGAPGQQSSSFLAPSTIASTNGSRASTPGVASDTPAEETGDGDTAENLPQVDLARSRVGEEDEDIVLELRGRALQPSPGTGWENKGVGYLRILKNRKTSRARIILRADPSGKVVLNAPLMKDIKYTIMNNSIHFLVPKAEGAPEQWAVRVKAENIQSLHNAIEESKS